MTIENGIALLAILATVVVGLLAAKTIRRKRHSQSQKIGRNGTGLQSGRDINIK